MVVLGGGRARSCPELQGSALEGTSGAPYSKEGSAGACRSLRTDFLCKLSILLFSFLILMHVPRLACLHLIS